MGSGLHDKCSCGRSKYSYSQSCSHCWEEKRARIAYFASETFVRQPTRSQNPNSVCKVCNVQISTRKEYCKSCRRDRERGQIKTNIPPTKRKCIENNCDADAKPDSRRCESHYVSCKVPVCNNEVKGTANRRYCDSHFNSKSSVKTSRENQDSVVFPCRICGKDNTAGRIAEGLGKTVGTTAMGVFGAAAILTGGLAGLALVAYGAGGARISGIAENYSICAECRAK